MSNQKPQGTGAGAGAAAQNPPAKTEAELAAERDAAAKAERERVAREEADAKERERLAAEAKKPKTVKMVRDDRFAHLPGTPDTADVAVDEVDNWSGQGWRKASA